MTKFHICYESITFSINKSVKYLKIFFKILAILLNKCREKHQEDNEGYE